MDEKATRAYLDRHAALFNDAVRTGSFDRFVATLAANAVMRFEGVPAGPFVGRDAIAEAYRSAPPDDTMQLVSMRPFGDGTLATFTWDHGGEGFFILETTDSQVTRLDVSFLPAAESVWLR